MSLRRVIVFGIALGALGVLARPALAATQAVYHGGTYFGSVVVEPGQVVDGDLTVIFGDATIEGIVEGNVNVVGGTYVTTPGGVVTGQVNQIGGAVAQAVVPWAPPDSRLQPLRSRSPAALAALVESSRPARLLDLPAAHAEWSWIGWSVIPDLASPPV